MGRGIQKTVAWGVLLLLLSTTDVAGAEQQDTTPLNLMEFDYTPKTVDVGIGPQTITLTLRIADNLSGFSYLLSYLQSPSGNQYINTYTDSAYLTSGNSLDGVYERKVVLPRYSEAGIWRVASLSTFDKANNRKNLYEADLKAQGFPTEINVTGLSDLAPPDLPDLGYRPKTIEVNMGPQTVTCTLKITDELAGFSYGWWYLYSPSGKESIYTYLDSAYRTSGSFLDGVYERKVVFRRYSEAGIWHMTTLCLLDTLNNKKCFSEADLKARDFPTETRVIQCSAASPELCDGVDNNCNGRTDENFDIGSSCSIGAGACKADGIKVCTADETGTKCSAAPGTPTAEVCDDLDNDCNGWTDEGLKCNSPPVADAGPDIACDGVNDIAEGETIFLGGVCDDEDATDLLTGTWSQNAGGTVCGTINGTPEPGEGPLTATAECIAPDVPANENESFRLTCDDGPADAADDIFVCVNAKPTAVPQSVSTREDTAVAVTLTGSDPNNEALIYTVLTGPAHGNLSGTPPLLAYAPLADYSGNDSFAFNVHDGIQSGGSAVVSLAVGSVNDIPSACAGPDQTVTPPVTVLLDGTCSEDADDDSLAFGWTQIAGEAAVLSNATEAQTSFSPAKAGAYTFRLVVNDGAIDSNPDLVNITVNNADPEAFAGEDEFVYEGERVELVCNGTDPNDDPLSYSWTQISGPRLEVRFPATTFELSITAPDVRAESRIVLACTVSDGAGGVDSDRVTVTVSPPASPEEPFSTPTTHPDKKETASTPTMPSADNADNEEIVVETAGRAWTLPFEGGDIFLPSRLKGSDGRKLTISWEVVSGPDLFVFEGNRINTTDYVYKRGIYQIRERAVDEGGWVQYSGPITIILPNNPPEPPLPEEFAFGEQTEHISHETSDGKTRFIYDGYSNVISFNSLFTDADDDQLVYQWSISNEGLKLVAAETGAVTLWNRKAGTRRVVVTVEDGEGGKTEKTIEFYLPPPEVTAEDTLLSITGRTANGAGEQTVSGLIESPVIPIVRVNGVTAQVTLVESAAGTVYRFTAEAVPVGTNGDGLDIEVLTDVDGEAVFLFNKSIAMETESEDGGGETPAGYSPAAGGCSLVR